MLFIIIFSIIINLYVIYVVSIKFISKCFIILFVNIGRITDKSFMKFTFGSQYATMPAVHQSFHCLLNAEDVCVNGKQEVQS